MDGQQQLAVAGPQAGGQSEYWGPSVGGDLGLLGAQGRRWGEACPPSLPAGLVQT